MAISLTVTPKIRPFRGFAQPELPDGFWAAHASVLGDGSGGLQSVNIRFSSATEPNVSTLWNLEQLLIFHQNNNNVRVDFGNMDIFPPESSTGALSKLIHLTLVDFGTAPVGRGLPLTDVSSSLPIFLGAAGKDVNGDLTFDIDNVTGVSFSVFAQGYFWGPASINAPGGPQRPLTGLYGR